MATVADFSWKDECKNLLDVLDWSDDAGPFRQPIDVLDAYDYRLFIDPPMNFGTIREYLQVGYYESPNDFAKDVRLIFEKSREYNPDRRRKVRKQTDRLSSLFEDLIYNVLTSNEIQKTMCKSELFFFNGLFCLQFQCFVGHFSSSRSNDTQSRKGKALAPTNSNMIKIANGVESAKEKCFPIRTNKVTRVRKRFRLERQMEIFNSINCFRSLYFQVLRLNPPIQELEQLTDLSSKMKKLVLPVATRSFPIEILSLVQKMSTCSKMLFPLQIVASALYDWMKIPKTVPIIRSERVKWRNSEEDRHIIWRGGSRAHEIESRIWTIMNSLNELNFP